MQLKGIYEGNNTNILLHQFSPVIPLFARLNEPLMRNIKGRKNHLLYLILALIFDAFLPPLLTKPTYTGIWQNIQIYGQNVENKELFLISINTYKDLQDDFRL